MDSVPSEFFGEQEGGDHVDRDADHGRAVKEGDDHGSDPLQQDGVETEQAEDGRAGRQEYEIEHRALQSRAFKYRSGP
jgi:hypothetical protein